MRSSVPGDATSLDPVRFPGRLLGGLLPVHQGRPGGRLRRGADRLHPHRPGRPRAAAAGRPDRRPVGPSGPDRPHLRARRRPGGGALPADQRGRAAPGLVAHRDPRGHRPDLHLPARLRPQRRGAGRRPEPHGCGRGGGGSRATARRGRRGRHGRARGRPHGDPGQPRLRPRLVVPQAPHPGRAARGRGGGHDGGERADGGSAGGDRPASPRPGAGHRGRPHRTRGAGHGGVLRPLLLADRERGPGQGVARGLRRTRLLRDLRSHDPRRVVQPGHRGRAGADRRRLVAGGRGPPSVEETPEAAAAAPAAEATG